MQASNNYKLTAKKRGKKGNKKGCIYKLMKLKLIHLLTATKEDSKVKSIIEIIVAINWQ